MLGHKLSSLLIAVLIAAPAAAQTVDSTGGVLAPARTATTSPVLSAGELLRVWAPRAGLDGIVASFARIDSNLVITGQSPNPDVAPREVRVPIDAVHRLEVWRGTERSKKRIFGGVVVGALVGAGLGATLTRLIECGGACDKEGNLAAKESPMLGATIGAPIGALFGGVIAGMKLPRWRQVTLSIR